MHTRYVYQTSHCNYTIIKKIQNWNIGNQVARGGILELETPIHIMLKKLLQFDQ